MPSARVSFRFCGETEDEGIPVTSMAKDALTETLTRCLPRGFVHVRVTYDGPIERGAAELFRRIDQLTVELDPSAEADWPLLLMINSGGGDVAEAMAWGNVLSARDWPIRIHHRDGRCYSACVLVYAAATDRPDPASAQERKALNKYFLESRGKPHAHIVPNDHTYLGIHRVLPTLSNATSISELHADTEEAVKLIGDYLATHGVSRTLAEDMMAVPSNQVRILKIDEVNNYGLGEVNSAKADLERLDILRRCGADYAQRREVFLRGAQVCMDMIRDEETVPLAQACMESVKRRTRIPDTACRDPRVGR